MANISETPDVVSYEIRMDDLSCLVAGLAAGCVKAAASRAKHSFYLLPCVVEMNGSR